MVDKKLAKELKKRIKQENANVKAMKAKEDCFGVLQTRAIIDYLERWVYDVEFEGFVYEGI